MNINKTIILTAIAATTQFAAIAQNNEIKSSSIASLQVTAGSDWLSMPITKLHGGEPINIGFDDLTHEYRRYAYRLEHCEADWTPSNGIFDSDFCEGFADGNTIDDIEESVNTNTLYTHYRLQIPNDRCRFKISGNYRLYVYDENEGDTVLVASFMVVDPQMNVSMSVSSNTDIDTNKSHQQVAWLVDYNSLRISDPEREISTVVLQNQDWGDARRNIQPQNTTPNSLGWEHNKELIFDGGNEYRKFEILDTSHPTLGIEDTWWDGTEYHAQIWTDQPRYSYTYDEDANGAFYIRNSDNIENDRISEYVIVHFRLQAPRQSNGIYINGVWTNGLFTPKYRMSYNELSKMYEAALKLKQGYYSYRYVSVDSQNRQVTLPSEGNFSQTENEYQALVYYRPIGGRTDQLVAYKEIKFK